MRDIPFGVLAGNADFELKAPSGYVWEVKHISIQLTTDATVANRYVFVTYRNIQRQTYSWRANSAVTTASQTNIPLHFYAGASTSSGATHNTLPNRLYIQENNFVRIYVSSGQAGDSWHGLAQVIERKIDEENF